MGFGDIPGIGPLRDALVVTNTHLCAAARRPKRPR